MPESTSNRSAERREHLRLECEIHDFHKGVINDISLSGLKYESSKNYAPGDDLNIVIRHPKEIAHFAIRGKIVWVSEAENRKRKLYGVKFDAPSEDFSEKIRSLIAEEGDRKLSLVKTIHCKSHRLPRYGSKFLNGVSTEINFVWKEKEYKARLVNFNQFGARITLDTTNLQLSGRIVENCNFFVDTKLIYSGSVRISNETDAGSYSEFGLSFLDCPLNVEEILAVRERVSLSYKNEDYAASIKSVNQISERFKIGVADFSFVLSKLKADLTKEQLGINAIDQESLRESLMDERLESICSSFLKVCHQYIIMIDESVSDLSDEQHKIYKSYYYEALGEYYRDALYAARAIKKPLGYPGDYAVMTIVYDDLSAGKTLWEKFMSRVLALVPPAQAVRNRAKYLYEKIKSLQPTESAQVMSVGCGPCKEIQYYLEDPMLDRGTMNFYLIDQDEEALAYAQNSLRGHDFNRRNRSNFCFHSYNVKDFLNDDELKNKFPKFDLIYSAGVFDYLPDQVFSRMIEVLFSMLSVGGRLVIGNFSSYNNCRYYMEYGLDWYLNYRSAEEIKKLIPRDVHQHSVVIDSEPTGINLFLNLVRIR